jgi:cysteinyl-tRNA synthetase
MEKIIQLRSEAPGNPAEPADGERGYLNDFEAHAAEDLNMPRCLADLWTLLRDSRVPPGQKLWTAFHMDRILSLGLTEAMESEVALDEETRKLLEERESARGGRNFKRADEIRALLLAKGIEVQDSPTGPKIRFAHGQRR